MSVSNKSKRRGTILDEIMRYHREQLPKKMRAVPLATLLALSNVAPTTIDFFAALKKPGVSLIAECKKASPSKGLLVPKYDPVALASIYAEAGASAISVLTDSRYFQGSLDDLTDVKEFLINGGRSAKEITKGIPVLRKDFIFHPYQLYESRAAGADAILLIASVLDGGELKSLINLTKDLGMQALVEVHTEEELDRALALAPQVIGINNRNLQTFEVDFENTVRLRQGIPAGVAVVGESGIRTTDDVRRMVEIGVDAILVGETLVKSRNVRETVKSLVSAGRI
jgi:indole-3-glycerol phosphate synthase